MKGSSDSSFKTRLDWIVNNMIDDLSYHTSNIQLLQYQLTYAELWWSNIAHLAKHVCLCALKIFKPFRHAYIQLRYAGYFWFQRIHPTSCLNRSIVHSAFQTACRSKSFGLGQTRTRLYFVMVHESVGDTMVLAASQGAIDTRAWLDFGSGTLICDIASFDMGYFTYN